MQFIKYFFVIALYPCLLSCSGGSTETEPEMTTTEDHHAAVMKASQAYSDAIKVVDSEKVISFWTEDLKIIQSSGTDIVGKGAFKEFLDSFYPTLQVYQVEISRNEVEAAPGNSSWEIKKTIK
jgi:ketosteroid isomerase-like protein